MKEVVIKRSLKKTLLRYLMVAFAFSPIIFIYFAAEDSKYTSQINPKYVLIVVIVLYLYLVLDFIIAVNHTLKTNLILMNSTGISIFDCRIHHWNAIDDIRPFYRLTKFNSDEHGISYKKYQYLMINDVEYDFTNEEQMPYSLNEIVEIIIDYKQKLSD